MAKWQYLLGILSLLIVLCNSLPVVPKEEAKEEEEAVLDEEEDTGLEYDRYLRQVIRVLEKDPEMKKRMEEMSLEDLKEGNFARELGFLSANIRSKLDELKRLEVQRLRTVARQRMEAAAGQEAHKYDFANVVGHLDFENPHFFEEKDFVQLIEKAAADLDEADKERRKEFKRYEMEKELDRRQKLKEMDQTNRLKAEQEFKERKDRIKNHPQIKHPGSKAQMREVWEETDHLDPDDFNPKTFFALHDTNGDKKLDMFELEALFIKEVTKIYEGNQDADPVEMAEEVSRMREHVLKEVEKIYKDTDADPREKFEEMSRMREHVLREIDLDGDKMVSRDEFMQAADQAQFDNDEGWKDINQDDQFTEDELQEYNRMVQERLEKKKLKMQQEHDRYLQQQQLNQPGQPIQMNQQGNLNQQPPQPGQDAKLRVNQPPVNQQVPVNQGQVPAQQGGQPIQQGQPPVNQASQQAGQVPVQQRGPPGGVPPNVAQNVAQQIQQQQQQQNKLPKPNIAVQQGQSIQGQPIQGQPIQGQPIQGQPIQGQPKPVQQGQPIQGQLNQGQPIQVNSDQGQPIQGQVKPNPAQPIQGQPIQGQPIQGQPIQGQPIPGKPPAQPNGAPAPVQGQPPAPVQGQPPAQPQGGAQGQPPAQQADQGANPPGQR